MSAALVLRCVARSKVFFLPDGVATVQRFCWHASKTCIYTCRVLARVFVTALIGAALALACTTYKDNLTRGQRLFQAQRFADALAVWRLMSPDMDALSRSDQARYAYLRGMTDYNLGFRADSRHWLALAAAIHEHEVKALDAREQGQLASTLDELNGEVYGPRPKDSASSSKEHGAAAASAVTATSAKATSGPATSADTDTKAEP